MQKNSPISQREADCLNTGCEKLPKRGSKALIHAASAVEAISVARFVARFDACCPVRSHATACSLLVARSALCNGRNRGKDGAILQACAPGCLPPPWSVFDGDFTIAFFDDFTISYLTQIKGIALCIKCNFWSIGIERFVFFFFT